MFDKQAYMKDYDKKRWATPEQKEKMKQYEIQNRAKPHRRFSKAKSQARNRKIDWSLTLDQFTEISEQKCFYCDEQLMDRDGKGGSHLDRIDNSKGYELDNVVSCCYVCNTLRNEHFSVEETKIAAQAIVKHRHMEP